MQVPDCERSVCMTAIRYSGPIAVPINKQTSREEKDVHKVSDQYLKN